MMFWLHECASIVLCSLLHMQVYCEHVALLLLMGHCVVLVGVACMWACYTVQPLSLMQVEGASTVESDSCIVSALLQPLHLFQHRAIGEQVAEAGQNVLCVGGPHRVWIKNTQQHYYTLTRAAGQSGADNDGEVWSTMQEA